MYCAGIYEAVNSVARHFRRDDAEDIAGCARAVCDSDCSADVRDGLLVLCPVSDRYPRLRERDACETTLADYGHERGCILVYLMMMSLELKG